MDPGHQPDPKGLSTPWELAEPSEATGAMDTTPDLSFYRTMDLDMALHSNQCLEVFMFQGGSFDHPDQHGHKCGRILEH